jgi:transaldolase
METIIEGVSTGLLNGVVLRPHDLKESRRETEKFLEDLLSEERGPIIVPLSLDAPHEMIREGQELYHFSNRVIPSIPACRDGYEAMFRLSRLSIPTFSTCILSPSQGFLSIQAGASFIEPWFNGHWNDLLSLKALLNHKEKQTQMIIGLLENKDDLIKCCELGFDGVSISKNLFYELIQEPKELTEVLVDYRPLSV